MYTQRKQTGGRGAAEKGCTHRERTDGGRGADSRERMYTKRKQTGGRGAAEKGGRTDRVKGGRLQRKDVHRERTDGGKGGRQQRNDVHRERKGRGT